VRPPSGLVAGVIGLAVGALAGAGLALLTAPEPTVADLEALAAELLDERTEVVDTSATGEVATAVLDPPAAIDEAARDRAADAGWRDLRLETGASLTGRLGIQRFELAPASLRLRYRAGDLVAPSAGLGAVTGAVALAAVAVLGVRRSTAA
jgi:hypothetical protein